MRRPRSIAAAIAGLALVSACAGAPPDDGAAARQAAEEIAVPWDDLGNQSLPSPSRAQATRARPARGADPDVARVCGSSSLLGPARPPRGARVVSPGQALDSLVERQPAGTTFWLRPGTHHMHDGEYSQVLPKPGMRFVGAPGAVLDGRGQNLYAFGGRATGVVVEHLTIQHFGGRLDNHNEGVVNHDAAADWVVRHNTIRRNGGAGVMVGDGNTLDGNCLASNGQYGFSAYEPDGVSGIRIVGNEITANNTADWESRIEGCGCSGGGKIWETRGARIEGNRIHANNGVGLWADTNNTEVLVEDNLIADNVSEGMVYETSYNARIVHNTFSRNGLAAGALQPGFPTPALYLSESGSDPRAGGLYAGTLTVSRNRFVDNWSGIIAWENADRFAGSPANTSTGYTTLVNPGVATEEACSDPDLIGQVPYYDDCRWKTQHLRVTENAFVLHPGRIGPECTGRRQCGYNGVFSQYGTYPSWSPYRGTVVENAITFTQDNIWAGNSYVGPWRFMALELGNRVSWRVWRGSRFHQDEGSTRR